MTRQVVVLAALLCGLLGVGLGALGCGSGDASSTSEPANAVYLVGLTATTVSSLPNCTSALTGTVAFVSSPPSLWACLNNQWTQITCTAAKSGSVAYASTTQMLFACVNRQWTRIALPDAGPPGPPGPQGPQGDAGAQSLVKLTSEPPGSNCPAGGERIDVGIDKDSDGILQSSEITQTAYVCNGLPGGSADAAVASDAADASDAANAFDGFDGGPNVFQQYATQYANAICTAFGTCCGATFDVAGCETALYSSGYDNTLPLTPSNYTAGHLTINQTQATACIAALSAWPCGATITSAQNSAILTACHGVLAGTIAIGGTGCSSSFECVSGAYCNGGTCTALATSGAACSVAGESADHQCSYIGTMLPALYCNAYPSDAGPSSGTGTCQPVQANGGLCTDQTLYFSDYACTGLVCDLGSAVCAASTTNPADPAAGFQCSSHVLDAGGGG